MKKKIIALVLSALMVLTALPVYAGGVTTSTNEKTLKPLTVTYGMEGLNYTSLGDSISFGFGLDENCTGKDEYIKVMTYSDDYYKYEVPGAYPILLKHYLKVADANFFQGSICGSRQQELCYLIDNSSVEPDAYYTGLGSWFFPKNSSQQADLERLTEDYGSAVKNADFISISAGGNTTMTLMFILDDNWGKSAFAVDLNRYYGKAATTAFYSTKSAILAQAKLIDNLAGQKKTEDETYAEKVEYLFDVIETILYSMGQNAKETELLLDLIHSKNSKAVIAYSGIPVIFSGYDLKIGNLLIDLEKIMKPMVSVINLAVKNAAEERSSYVRYIDVSDVDLCTASDFGPVIELKEDFTKIISNYPEITHPSYKGHQQIEQRILASFEFKQEVTGFSKVKNLIENINTMVRSRLGTLKIQNFIAAVKQFNPFGLIKIDWSGLTLFK